MNPFPIEAAEELQTNLDQHEADLCVAMQMIVRHTGLRSLLSVKRIAMSERLESTHGKISDVEVINRFCESLEVYAIDRIILIAARNAANAGVK